NQIQIASVSNRWPEIVGPNIAEHTHIESFEGKKIVVRCTSTAWAKQLQLLLPRILRRISEVVGSGVVEQVVVLGPVAPSWK
ncbi:DciA family protein, partial [Streptococcus anginosus]|nr:DciA family protein [Streptococcus anginosus]